MKKFKKLPFKLIFIIILGIILTISVGLSIWLITDRIEIKPELDANKVITQYLDGLETEYLKDTVSLPSNSAVGLVYGSEDLTYYYKLIKDSNGNDVSNEPENKMYNPVEGKNGPTNAGTYAIKVEYLAYEDTNKEDGDDTLIITTEVTFIIHKAKINMDGVSFVGDELTYDKEQHNITISGTLPKDEKGNTVITDVVYTCDNKIFTGATNAGTYNVVASFVYDEANYETIASKNATLKINPKSITLSSWEFEDNPNKIFYHTGSEITTIKSSLLVKDNDNEKLKENTHYDVLFSDIVNLGTAHTFTITGKGNYTGKITGTYTIKEKIYNLIVTPNNTDGKAWQTVTYNGGPQRPSVTVKDADNNIINDATLKYYINEVELTENDLINVGIYPSVKIVASKDGYSDGMCNFGLQIEAITLNFTWSNNIFQYDGEEHIPSLTATGILDIDKDKYSIKLVTPQINAGSYTASAVLSGPTDVKNYKLPNNQFYNFEIKPKSVNLLSTSIGLAFDSKHRTWDSIKTLIINELSFDGVIGNENLGGTITGMHNGVYAYGTVNISGLETTTNVVGSTYQATVSITNKNYVLSNNRVILKYKTALVGGVYYTIEDAFSATGTITFAGDATNATSHVITCFTKLTGAQGNPYNKTIFNLVERTLLVPYENSLSEKTFGTSSTSYVYTALIVPKGITINANTNSNIIVGAKIDYNQSVTATRALNRGVLMNNGTIICGNGTTSDVTSIKAYGYIKGVGDITINKYSRGYESMSIYDFAGGKATLKVQSSVMPMNSWSMHNNSCKTKIMSGAEYFGMVYMELSIVGGVDAEFHAIGSRVGQNCIFVPSDVNDSTYVIKYTDIADEWKKEPEKHTDLDTITGSNQLKGQKDLYDLYGSYTDDSFQISVSMASLSTAKGESKPCPVSFMDLTLKKGASFSVTHSDYLFLPGTSCTIEEGATLTIGEGVHATFATWNDIASLSGGFNTRCIDQVDAKLIVKGTLNVYGQIAGKITAGSSNAILTIGEEAKLSTSANTYNDNPVGTVSNIKPYATANIIEGELAINSSYVAEENTDAGENDDKFLWKPATSIKFVQIILYDSDGTTELYTVTLQVVNTDTKVITNKDFTASKPHYVFNNQWFTMDGQEFSSTTLQAVTKEELELETYEPLKLKASWILKTYKINYITSYGQTENGELNYITEKDGLIFNDKLESFTIDSFKDNILTIPTTASYKVDEVAKNMDGWYIGNDKSSGIRISSLTLKQFETILEKLNGETTIALYCEFTDNEFFNVVITDDKHPDNKVISQGYIIEGGKSIISSGNSIPSFDTSAYDDDPTISYFFNGFIDDNNNVYTLEQLEQLEITSNMTFKVNWSEKFALKYYDEDNSFYYIPGTKGVDIKDSSSQPDYLKVIQEKVYIVNYTLDYWDINGVRYDKDGKYDVPNLIGGSATITAKFKMTDEKYYYFDIVRADDCTVTLTANNSIVTITNNVFTIGNSSTTSCYIKVGTSVSISISADFGKEITSLSLTKNNTVIYNQTSSNAGGPYTMEAYVYTIDVVANVSCLAEGTLVTLGDGTRKPIEELNEGDTVLAWDFVKGEYIVTPILNLIYHGCYDTRIINLKFADGTVVRVIEEHGFFNYSQNNWSMISESNYLDFIGDDFVMQVENISSSNYKTVKLVDAFITYETVGVYSLFTSYAINCFTEGVLSVTPLPMQGSYGFTQYFEFGENLKYDEKQMQEDIQKYGLYTYDEWKEYMTYEEFEAIGLKYLKISVGKGLITKEDICFILNIRV